MKVRLVTLFRDVIPFKITGQECPAYLLLIFSVIFLTVSVAYSQETGDNQVSPPPFPALIEEEGGTEETSAPIPVEGEEKTEGAAVPAETTDTEKGDALEKEQKAAPPVKPVEEQVPSTWAVEVTPKFRAVELDRESSKAREYRALSEGLYIDSLLFNYGAQTQEFGAEFKRSYLLAHLIDDGYGKLSYRRYGLLDVDLSLSRFPRVYSTPPPIDLSSQRDTYDLRFKFTPGDKVSISAKFSVEERKGERPLTVESFTGLTGSPTAIIEIADPVDYTTTTINLGLEYLDDILDIQADNMLQIFSNNLRDEVTWDNPYQGSDGKAKTAGDYTVHTLSIRPAVKLGKGTKLLNTLSYSKVTSSIDLIPFTTVSDVGEAFSRDVLDTDVRSLTLSSILSLRPLSNIKLNVKYRFYSLRNGTPQIEETPPYVMIDGDANAIRYPRIPRYMAYSVRNIGLDGAWSLTNRISLEADIEKRETIREEREVDKENENRAALAVRSRFFDNLSGKFSYTLIRRRGSYDPTYYNTVYDPDPANDVTQHPLMRSFDLSRLDSDSFTVSADYSPFDVLSLGSALTQTSGRHPDADIGRRRSWSGSVSVHAQYTPIRDLLFYSEYYYDLREIEGRYAWTFKSDLVYPQDPIYSDFTSHLTGTLEDISNIYVIGLDYNINQRLSIVGRYGRYDTEGRSINLPDVSSTTDIFEINASYRLHQTEFLVNPLKEVKINAGYYWEDYTRDDYALNNFPAGVLDPDIDADIFLGIREPDYRLSIFSLSLSLYF